jgi:proline dehydrogenase
LLRAFFIWLSQNQSLRAIAEKSSFGRRLSSRFVAGTAVEDALAATAAVNAQGCSVSLDSLGENVTNAEEAQRSADT